jgi:3',5'-cyclic AMP phosphodiesterase CpdA
MGTVLIYNRVEYLVNLFYIFISKFKLMINIIHLSDLHFGQDTFPYDIQNLKECLAGFIKQFNNPIVLITGDITFKGRPQGYECATDFFNYFIKEKLVNRADILCCPGNHDIGAGIKPFTEYDRFAYSLRKDALNSFSENNFRIHKIKDVTIFLLNSAYHQDYEYGLIDENVFSELYEEKDTFKVVAVHHHFIGQLKSDGSTIRNAYPSLFHFDKAEIGLVVHGHQHCKQQLPIGDKGFNIQAVRALGFATDTYQNGINHIHIENNKAKVTPYYFSMDKVPNKITLIKEN